VNAPPPLDRDAVVGCLLGQAVGDIMGLPAENLSATVAPPHLLDLFRQKYGEPDATGPNPRMRLRFGYFTPDDHYEALVATLVTPGCRWLDVGGGRDVFPSNPSLARQLADRCGHLTGVDPSPNIHENPYVHEAAEAFIEDYASAEPFDLLTLRMVAEHIAKPTDATAAMARLVKPGGKVVIYTVNKFAPVSLVAWATPFWLHHPIKKFFWNTEEKDTFPVAYKMNTRDALARLATAAGFRETAFEHLDDCRTFAQFKGLNFCEMVGWKMLHTLRVPYPENCLLGVYERL